MSARVALYLRSSKDRADASIAAQRRALKELAAARRFVVVQEFVDAVESGKDDNRPGFQELVCAVRRPDRGWDKILVLDTARLARRRLLAIIFEEQECRRHGVTIVYKSLPEGDPITDMLLKSILQAMDEWHSMTSKQKGLAGLTENVKSGYRAGGRAPLGYRLMKIATGAVRDGSPVVKSKLAPDDESEKVALYLRQRAQGVPRRLALMRAGLGPLSQSTLVGMERNALTYAGQTVWNVHAERVDGSYIGGRKRRPRSEWVIQPGTHEPLISEREAEAILSRFESDEPGPRRRHRPGSLLGGMMRTPSGTPWHGDGNSYRTREGGRSFTINRLEWETGLVEQVIEDLASPALLGRLTDQVSAAIRSLTSAKAPSKQDRALEAIERDLKKLLDLAVDSSAPAPLLRRIEKLESDREAVLAEQKKSARSAPALGAAAIRPEDLKKTLRAIVKRIDETPREHLREVLDTFVERVELDPENLTGSVHYRIAVVTDAGVKLASPRGFEPRSLP